MHVTLRPLACRAPTGFIRYWPKHALGTSRQTKALPVVPNPASEGARPGQQHADSNSDSNAATHRASAAHHDIQHRGALTHQPATWSELIRMGSMRQARVARSYGPHSLLSSSRILAGGE